MKVLVIGSGGREHALVWKISQSPKVKAIYCAPGNAGIAELAECVAISPEDVAELKNFVERNEIDLTIVGPELPLSLGLVDEFEKAGLKVFGPRKNAAILEFSKCFTKEFLERHKIPTAPFEIHSDPREARKSLEARDHYPVVIKADGLAAGKGVIIAKSRDEAFQAVEDMMLYEKFGEAGRHIVIEDFMPGEEATFMVAADGNEFVCLESCQDHKRIFDNDEGPNTGGMGAISPARVVTPEIHEKVITKIIKPMLAGMIAEGRPYRGILYAGLMISDNEPRIVEFNCRFGDPEAQAILMRLDTDLISVIEAVIAGKTSALELKFTPKPAVCVVMAAGGYPGNFERCKEIKGLKAAARLKDAYVFHAGTKKDGERILTNGGRVLGVTALGKDLGQAIERAYQAVDLISWQDEHHRNDIGQRGLAK